MKYIVIITAVMTILESFRLSIYYLRKDISIIRKIFETIILVFMILLCFYNLKGVYKSYLSLIIDLYVLIMFIYERVKINEYVSILSVKKSIDMANIGIMFLNTKGDIILINNLMCDLLKKFHINNDYISNLIDISFRRINNEYLIKDNDIVWQLKINNNEVTLIDITNIYKLQEKIECQNKIIEEDNNKIIETINNIEKIEKTKNLLKIKNEYHDMLGHRLALFTKYLENDNKNSNDIMFLLESIYDENNEISYKKKLDNLIKMYKIVGINIDIIGNFDIDERVGNIIYEVIREAVTNAIIHAESKNIIINIDKHLDKTILTIKNDGKKPSKIIHENEGIKGIRRKLSNINGNLTVYNDKEFILKVEF